MLKLCTGNYMNYYGKYATNRGLFIIINEGNGQATEALDPEKVNHADEICKEILSGKKITKEICEKLEARLDDIFEFGTQVFYVE